MQRLIIQMAQAVNHGDEDLTTTAQKAMEQALNQVNIAALETLGLGPDDAIYHANIGAPDPGQIDIARCSFVAGKKFDGVRVQQGGLIVDADLNEAPQTVVTVAIELFLPRQTEWRLTSYPSRT